MVAEAMTETASDEDTRNDTLVGQVEKERVRVQKAHSLIGQVYDPRNLARAWRRVKDNRGAGGVDRVSVDRFAREHRRYLTVLHRRLAEGGYRPQPVRRVEIDKPGSTAKRPLGIPTVVDRVCQQALRQVLEPIFEPTCASSSSGATKKGVCGVTERQAQGSQPV
jgi:retron-type reverse transcriptase